LRPARRADIDLEVSPVLAYLSLNARSCDASRFNVLLAHVPAYTIPKSVAQTTVRGALKIGPSSGNVG
jgi:hypothetical protein